MVMAEVEFMSIGERNTILSAYTSYRIVLHSANNV